MHFTATHQNHIRVYDRELRDGGFWEVVDGEEPVVNACPLFGDNFP
jgi:hypothetical protein